MRERWRVCVRERERDIESERGGRKRERVSGVQLAREMDGHEREGDRGRDRDRETERERQKRNIGREGTLI